MLSLVGPNANHVLQKHTGYPWICHHRIHQIHSNPHFDGMAVTSLTHMDYIPTPLVHDMMALSQNLGTLDILR